MVFRRAPVFWLGFVLTWLAGCGHHECEDGEVRCQGRERMGCYETGCHDPSCAFNRESSWSTEETCRDACVNPYGYQAICAASDTPDPICTGRDNTGYCDGDTAVHCFGGFATSRASCAQTQAYCVFDSWRVPFCALGRQTEPTCSAAGRETATVCNDATVVTCRHGYATAIEDCASACVSPAPGDAFCAASSEADPRCEVDDGSGLNPSFCTSEKQFGECDNGFLRLAAPCSPNDARCSQNDAGASCSVFVASDAGADRSAP